MTHALLLMDLQIGIVNRFASTDDFVDRVVAAQQHAEQAGVLVVLVRVGFSTGYPEISSRNKAFSAAKNALNLLMDDPAVALHPRLIRGHGEVVVTKKRVSALTGSDLDLVLRAHDVTSLVLGGIATSGVVLSTVRCAVPAAGEVNARRKIARAELGVLADGLRRAGRLGGV